MSRGRYHSGHHRGRGGPHHSRGGRGNFNAGNHYGSQTGFKGKPALCDDNAYKSWQDVKVKIVGYPYGSGIPDEMFAGDVWNVLKCFGNMVKVEVLPARDAYTPRIAYVTFSPPPKEAFWQREKIHLSGSSSRWIKAELQDPTQKVLATGKMTQSLEVAAACRITRIDFGFMYEADHLAIKRSVHGGPNDASMRMTINADRRELTIYFDIDNATLEEDAENLPNHSTEHNSLSSGSSGSGIIHEYRVQIPFKQIQRVGFRRSRVGLGELIISLPTLHVPNFFKKLDPARTFEPHETYWTQNKMWQRRTTICSNVYGAHQRTTSLSLNEPTPFIDIGSWTTYRVFVRQDELTSDAGLQFRDMLGDFNISIHDDSGLRVMEDPKDVTSSALPFWKAIDHDHDPKNNHASILGNLHSKMSFDWEVRYQLEVCISKDILNPTNITEEFLVKLAHVGKTKAVRRLEYIADKGKRLFDPMEIFIFKLPKTSNNEKVSRHHILQRSITVKPSSVEYLTPSVDESNRVIRFYKTYADRFIRVNFRDEKGEGKIFSSDSDTNSPLFSRVFRCLNQGFRIGDRHYEWLASGNSQFREHGAYFFASIPGVITANKIRQEMGNFTSIHQVAKLNARMGQCFSTTREFEGTVQIASIPDVELTQGNVTICFTDGVGKVSTFLTDLINTQLKFSTLTTAYQFRFGGSKGVIAMWHNVPAQSVLIRPSQAKFTEGRKRLEIIRPAVFVRPELNRQLITNLVCLGVPENIFLRKLDKMLADINEAMNDQDKAKHLLRKRTDVNSMTLTIRDMVKAGFMRVDDPFVRSLLMLWRAWSHKKLKEKASIQIDQGAFVMGITDESRVLRGHFNSATLGQARSMKAKLDALPEIFLQVNDQKDDTVFRVIEGICILARNPSLHPGDIRVVKAVNRTQLHHLRNVVVFPQTGDVDIPSMCSGGDLDGDDYFISWDEDLLPPAQEWNFPHMTHTPATPEYKANVTEQDIKAFFVNHMKQDFLGKIANAWLAQADQLDYGPKEHTCRQLAHLHSAAVDFPKTGVPVSGLDFKRLQPRRYPHYLESSYRPAHKIYHSSSAVGELYDKVERIEYQPLLHLPFDRRVLTAFDSDPELDKKVRKLKHDYDAGLRRIMAQFGVETEAEIWTGFIMHHDKGLKEYELQSKIGNLVNAHKDHYRELCLKEAGDRKSETYYPFIAAMYKVTAQEVRHELSEVMETFGYNADSIVEMAPEERPLMSFPWIFHDELGKIAKRRIVLSRTDDAAQAVSHKEDMELLRNDADDQRGVLAQSSQAGEGAKNDPLPVAGFLGSSNEDQSLLSHGLHNNSSTRAIRSAPIKSSTTPVAPHNNSADERSSDNNSNSAGVDTELAQAFATLNFKMKSDQGDLSEGGSVAAASPTANSDAAQPTNGIHKHKLTSSTGHHANGDLSNDRDGAYSDEYEDEEEVEDDPPQMNSIDRLAAMNGSDGDESN